jgi:hypothetical protein
MRPKRRKQDQSERFKQSAPLLGERGRASGPGHTPHAYEAHEDTHRQAACATQSRSARTPHAHRPRHLRVTLPSKLARPRVEMRRSATCSGMCRCKCRCKCHVHLANSLGSHGSRSPPRRSRSRPPAHLRGMQPSSTPAPRSVEWEGTRTAMRSCCMHVSIGI